MPWRTSGELRAWLANERTELLSEWNEVAVLRRTLSTGSGLPSAGNPYRNAVNWQLGFYRTDAINLHRNFSCLNDTAIGVSR